MTKKLPNIVLIVMDTMGAKHMSLYGYPRQTTPHLEHLAQDCTVYTRCFAPACWTIPSHASMFTGLYPSQHGAYEGKLFLDENVHHLVPILKYLGYRTYGISSNGLVSPATGLCRDFDSFVDFASAYLGNLLNASPDGGALRLFDQADEFTAYLSKGLNSFEKLTLLFKYIWATGQLRDPLKRVADGLKYRINHLVRPNPFFKSSKFTEKSLEITSQIINDNNGKTDAPFFLFINFMEAHEKYRPPLRYRRFSRWYDKQIANMGGFYHKEKNPQMDALLELNRNLYDDEIFYLDNKINSIWTLLKNSSFADNTIFIITSDHGEHFGEKGLYGHRLSLYNELIWVPLIIQFPKGMVAPGMAARLVSLNDLYATLLDLLQCPLPCPESSVSLLDNNEREFAIAQYIYPEGHENDLKALEASFNSRGLNYSPPIMATITAAGKKIIEKRDGGLEIYDLGKDPTESHDLAPEVSLEVFENLRTTMDLFKHETGYNDAVDNAKNLYNSEKVMKVLTSF